MAADVKEKVLDALDDLRQAGTSLLEGFKEQTPYFKARVGVVAAYVVAVLLTVVMVPPPVERNALDAVIKVGSISFGSREKTYVDITNNSKNRWEEATVVIAGTGIRNGTAVTGTWTMSERWRPAESRKLTPEMFKDRDGLRPELDVKITTVSLTVEGVTVVKDLTVQKSGG
jgi:hypothetical protein